MKTKKILLLLSIVLLVSCKKEKKVETFDFNYEYYPIEVGFWQSYDVKEIVWNSYTNSVDTSYYQTKELIESIVVNANKDSLYRLECYKRNNSDEVWSLDRIYFLQQHSNKIERHEENLVFCKMVFPFKLSTSWNQYLGIEDDVFFSAHYPNTGKINVNVKNTDAIISEFPIDTIVNGHVFEDCATVLLHDFKTTINQDTEIEYYAPNVGMIYQKIIHTESSASGGVFSIVNGFEREVTISDYKK